MSLLRLPDWTGQTVLVAASGPSQRKEDIARARGKAKVIVINETWRLAPWADLLYACDSLWWRDRAPLENAFRGARYIGDGEHEGCTPCGVKPGGDAMMWCGDTLGAGGNSGFQALNLAAMTGAKEIILTGFDLQLTDGKKHHHADHRGGLLNPDRRMLRQCAKLLDQAADDLAARGVTVINCTRETALKEYPRASIKDVL